jgi:hypothetical protein
MPPNVSKLTGLDYTLEDSPGGIDGVNQHQAGPDPSVARDADDRIEGELA